MNTVIDTTNNIFRINCGAEFALKLIGRKNCACVLCACLSMWGSHALFWSSHPVLKFPPNFPKKKLKQELPHIIWTQSSDIKPHQNCIMLWNKMLTNEEVIMTVKLWGVDRRFNYIILNPMHSLFSAFCWTFLFLLFWIYETYPHSSV